jgi:DNA polymerase-1
LFERDNKRPGSTREIMKCLKGLFEAIKRQGKNTPIQGSGADCVKIAVGCGKDAQGPFLWHRIKEYDACIINCVHDEIVIEASETDAEAVEAVAKDAMIRAGAQLVKSVIMDVEGNISDEWSK